MAKRISDYASSLGDVKNYLGGRAFGEVVCPDPGASPAKITIDASAGDTFVMPIRSAATPIRVGAPINFADGSEITLVFKATSTVPTVTFLTSSAIAWGRASATFTLTANKTRMIRFKYVAALNKFVELDRTLIAGVA